jgi:aryl sulfotransferase
MRGNSIKEMGPEEAQYPTKRREHWHHLLDSTVWNEFQFRENDIIISAYSKSGTTWVQQIVAQLLWNGAEHIILADVSPWIDCRFPSREERLNIVAGQSYRRFLKSHLPVDALLFSRKAKYLYIGREGRDVLWSLYNHHRIFKKDVIQSIDNVPERTGPPLGDAPSSVVEYFREWLSKDGYPWWPYWEHVLSWWEIKDLPNVMLLHFSNLKKDMPGEIQRIASFLEIDIEAAKWDEIIEHCTFDYMKAHAAQFVPFGGDIFEGGPEAFMHKGTSGRWKDLPTPDDIEKYERISKEKLGPACAHWLSTGSL